MAGTPPPAYTDFAGPEESSNPSSYNTYSPPPFSAVPSYTHFPRSPQSSTYSAIPHLPHANPPLYGPTPLQDQPRLTLLPYYNPQARPYTVADAASRAKWRFVGSFLWAVGILVAATLALERVRR